MGIGLLRRSFFPPARGEIRESGITGPGLGLRHPFTIGDWVVIGVLLVAGLIFTQHYWRPSESRQPGPLAVVIRSESGRLERSLEGDDTVSVAGPLGVTRVVIADGAVRVERSPCPHKVCVKWGEIRSAGQWVACVPNKVLVRIEAEGDGRETLDAVTW